MNLSKNPSYTQLVAIYNDAYIHTPPNPCNVCGKVTEFHHATRDGRNLCHDCWVGMGLPVTQCYPGDAGGGIS